MPDDFRGSRITEIRVSLAGDGEPTRLLAYASFVLDDAFVIDGVRVMQRPGDASPWLAFPSRRGRTRHYDQVHPIDMETREWITAAVLEAYARERRRAFETAVESALADAAIETEPVPSSCGHPTEQAAFEVA